MKNCIRCSTEFHEKKSFEKYCSLSCCKKAQYEREIHRRRTDDTYRSERNSREAERRRRNRDKSKHALEEKLRYRLKNNIQSDDDLKKAPKGSGCLTSFGYRKVHKKGHPNAWRNGDMFEHVFVMSEFLKRPLVKGETVHHKNGIKSDNRIDNLELWSHSQPYGQRIVDKVQWCKEFLNLYGFDVIKKEDK